MSIYLSHLTIPKAYRFDLLDAKYHEAYEKEIGIYGSHYTNTMMVELGVTLHFAAGSDKNIKLTTKDDLEMFKAYLKADTIHFSFVILNCLAYAQTISCQPSIHTNSIAST